MTDAKPGARWIRAALQVNPYAYKGKNQPSSSFSSEHDYNTALLDQCVAQGISLIAVTDHWCVDSAKGLIDAAKDRGIVALPGFEANSSEGVHILVIFEADADLSAVNAAIGACGVQPECDNGTPGNSFKEILEAMSSRGALVIPAHVNVPNSGMLTGRSGPPLVSMVKDPNLHAIAVTPSQVDGTDQKLITAGAKPYDRKHPLAVIYADDIVHPDQLKTAGASSWFKVSSRRMESLKLAVRTPETRVASTDPTGPPRPMLKEISWIGGFLDGVTVPISSDLTTLIGGRGTGKSTVIESLRYALGITPIGTDATADHKAIIDKVLRTGTIVKVEVETVSPTPHRFTIERVVPNLPVVRDAAGTATSQQPIDVAGLVEVFGQHELAELASSPASVAEMLHRFAGTGGHTESHLEVLSKLTENRDKLERAEAARAKLADELVDIPRLKEQVKQYTETEVAQRLAELHRLSRDESMFTEGLRRVSESVSALEAVLAPELDTTLVADYEGLDDSPQKEILQRVSTATTRLATELKNLADQANTAITTAQTEIADAKSSWDTAVKDQRDGHAEVLRKLHEEGLEPDRYLDTSKALDELNAKEPLLTKLDGNIKVLMKDRGKLIGELSEHERVQVEKLHDAVRSANDATGGVVVVRPIAAPDRTHITDVIGDHVSGPRAQITAAVTATEFSPHAFVTAARAGTGELEKIGIRGAQASALINAGEPYFESWKRWLLVTPLRFF